MARESNQNKINRITKIIKLFRSHYPDVHCELNFSTSLELLIATMLSAQCTDKRVNQVTPKLFKAYPSAKDYATAPLGELEEYIRTTGFFRSKAQRIQACCERLVEVYEGRVPSSLEDLVTLSGVGRKTAHVVLGNAFNISSGIVVDTHAIRLSNRLGFVYSLLPEKIEIVLNKLVPKKEWIFWSHAIVHHGRYLCKARKPDCKTCFIASYCPKKIL